MVNDSSPDDLIAGLNSIVCCTALGLKDQGFTWYYVVDKNSEVADAFGANRTPECFLFNKEDKLVYHGAIDDNPGGDVSEVGKKYLKEAINEMLSNKEVSVKTSRSVGCSIKRKA